MIPTSLDVFNWRTHRRKLWQYYSRFDEYLCCAGWEKIQRICIGHKKFTDMIPSLIKPKAEGRILVTFLAQLFLTNRFMTSFFDVFLTRVAASATSKQKYSFTDNFMFWLTGIDTSTFSNVFAHIGLTYIINGEISPFISLYSQNIPQTCYLVALAPICEELRNASKNFFAFKGAPYMVNLISTDNFSNNSRLNDLLAK